VPFGGVLFAEVGWMRLVWIGLDSVFGVFFDFDLEWDCGIVEVYRVRSGSD